MNSSIQSQILQSIDDYVRSINELDIPLAESFWLTNEDVTFIHPRGHEKGWQQVLANFYGLTMGESFTKRDLKLDGEVAIKIFGDTVIAEFDWDFVAMRRDIGEELHTTGRESQVWCLLENLGWRLVQVHYSGPATTAAGEGF